jgi:hypothetical protein
VRDFFCLPGIVLNLGCRAKEKEIQKKEAVLAKQAQTMSMFFKPKTAASPSSLASSAPISRESPAGPSSTSPS